MKTFKSWFRKKPKPTDILLVLEYEYEEPMQTPVIIAKPDYRHDGPDFRPISKKSRLKKKDKSLEPEMFVISPTNVPEPLSYSLTLKNLSVKNAAINISVPPMVVKIPEIAYYKDGKSEKTWSNKEILFSPKEISSLEPGKSVQITTDYKDLGSIEKTRLPKVLHLAADPTNINELFNDYTFPVKIYFGTTDGRFFEVTQEIVFRPWKNKTTMGKISRKEIFDADL